MRFARREGVMGAARPKRAVDFGLLLLAALVTASCASMNYTEKCREQMNDCMRECAERSQSTPGTLPTCTTCKPEAERCDAQERLVESQSKQSKNP
ncbi:MAG: hypothetical protein JST54_03880 [Deltaproteobacteria bacterium]|nr:hypothetical protein [Deltaproteobacteria bacterium]